MASTNGTAAAGHYEAESVRLEELKGEDNALERREAELRSRISTPRDDVGEAAAALLDGGEVVSIPHLRGKLEVVKERRPVVRRAIELQRKRVEVAKAERDRVLLDAAEPAILKAVQEVAERGVALSESVDVLHGLLEALDVQGITRLHRFPGPRLFPLRASEPTSRLNGFIDELERDYGVSVKRPLLDETVKARHRAHLAAEKARQLRDDGSSIAAGPDGVFTYRLGKRVPVAVPSR